MNKIVIALLLTGSIYGLSAAQLMSASIAKQATKESTIEVTNKLLNSEKGRKAYTSLTNFYNKNISVIAGSGFYNMFHVTFMTKASKKEIEGILSPLNKKEQDILRSVIINDLVRSGFTVTKNEYWNNPNAIYISVSW